MIVVTRLNDSQFALNPDLIERIHATPDTTIVLLDGAKYIVTESMDEVIDSIARYRARVITLARSMTGGGFASDEVEPHHAILGLVPDPDDHPKFGQRASAGITDLPSKGGRN